MQILVHSDHNLVGGESLRESVEGIVHAAVDRFSNRITRVEVHVSDANASKHGATEKHCVMEAHVGGMKPVAVTHKAPLAVQAIEGAADKLERALDHALSRRDETRGRSPRPADVASVEELQELEAKKR